MAIQAQWAELLVPGLRQIFEVQREALAAESCIPILFGQGDSTRAQEFFLGMGGMSDWEEYHGTLEYDDLDKLYKTTLTHKEFVKAFTVERKLVDDDQYNVINARPAQLAMSAMRTREKHAASMFTNAFDGTYVGGDGQPLCSDAHPLSPTHASDTWGNLGSSSLDYDSIIATRKLMRKYVDDRKNLIPMKPDTIVYAPDLSDTAETIAKSMQKPGTADNDANVASGLISNWVQWDYLDGNSWFMIDSQMGKQFSLWLDRTPLEFLDDPTGEYALELRCRGYMRYSFGWSDWRWVFGHQVS